MLDIKNGHPFYVTMDARFVFPANISRNYLAGAGAAGAAGAAAGAAGAAGASTFGAASCFGASLQPNTAIDKEATKIILTKMANTFLIIAYPPFKNFYSLWDYTPNF
jgi:hypothetical protein